MTLTIKAGRWYRRRDGKIVGPVRRNINAAAPDFLWRVGCFTYLANGRWRIGGRDLFDLISEVPAPKPKPTRRPKPKRKMVRAWAFTVGGSGPMAISCYRTRRLAGTARREGSAFYPCGPIVPIELPAPPTPKGKRK